MKIPIRKSSLFGLLVNPTSIILLTSLAFTLVSSSAFAVTCDPKMTIFPVGAKHNIGYDNRSCGSGTCAISCPDVNANSDWQPSDHQGIDVFAFRGAPMVAVADGTIVRVGVPSPGNPGSGLRVRLRDSCGWEYYYGHLDSASVVEGQSVKAGDVLGVMGSTGTGGVHLHFNISPDGMYSSDINPFALLESTSGTACATPPVEPPVVPPEAPAAVLNPDPAAPPSLELVGSVSRFSFVDPTRVFDTRPDMDSSRLVRSDGSSNRLSGGVSGTVTDWPSLPAGATGVWLSLTALNSPRPGYAVAYPNNTVPNTSNLNFNDGQTRANSIPIPFDTSNAATFGVSNEVDLVADLVGAFATEGLGLQNVPPVRVSDSRPGPISAATEHRVNVSPFPGAVGVVATVTAISQGQSGFLTAYPCDKPRPETSNINFDAAGAQANTVISPISGNDLCFWSPVPVNVVVDVTGYLIPSGGLSYQALLPTRILNTLDDTSLYVGRLGATQVVEIPIQTLSGAPDGIASVMVNVTAFGTTSNGNMTVYACGTPQPPTSNINHGTADAVGVVAISQLGDGKLCVHSADRAYLIVDLLGVWIPTVDQPTPDPSGDMGISDTGISGDSGMSGETDIGNDNTDTEGSGNDVEGGCSIGSDPNKNAPFIFLFGLVVFFRRRSTRNTK